MVKFFLTNLFVLIVFSFNAQNYTSYFTGDTSDVITPTIGVTVLMGGATEHDSAMVWFLQNSGGGDIVVLRASGSNGYNNYMYSDLGVSVNSVQTIVCNNASASYDPYIIHQLMNAEALWFAGGDQWNYISYWNNTPIDTAINYLINVKKIPVGGTSAGMAILGSIVFTAQNGSATSAVSLANPYVSNVTLLKDDFIFSPWLTNVVTDTHYDNPDRRGRHVTFLARIIQDYGIPAVYGIACNEYVAVCIDTNGQARVFGDYPNYQEFAYFLQANCEMPNFPETCVASQPLTWNRNSQAVKVYKVHGTPSGINTFQLSNWNTGSGGTWQDWYVNNGILQTNTQAFAPDCNPAFVEKVLGQYNQKFALYPNPVMDILNFKMDKKFSVIVYDMYSKFILEREYYNMMQLDVSDFCQGYYMAIIKSDTRIFHFRFLKI